MNEKDTLRFPAELDQPAMVSRLVSLRAAAKDLGLAELVSLLDGVESASPAQLGRAILSAAHWLEDKPQHGFMAKQMQLLAMNLKNLK